ELARAGVDSCPSPRAREPAGRRTRQFRDGQLLDLSFDPARGTALALSPPLAAGKTLRDLPSGGGGVVPQSAVLAPARTRRHGVLLLSRSACGRRHGQPAHDGGGRAPLPQLPRGTARAARIRTWRWRRERMPQLPRHSWFVQSEDAQARLRRAALHRVSFAAVGGVVRLAASVVPQPRIAALSELHHVPCEDSWIGSRSAPAGVDEDENAD